MKLKANIQNFLLGFSGCTGGNIHSPIWFCGIEWGGGYETVEELEEYIAQKELWEKCPVGDETTLEYPYGRTTIKLLTSIYGSNVEDYINFFETYKPTYTNSEKSCFQLNLYPIAFKNTDPKYWNKNYDRLLGFKDKPEYVRWCQRYRFAEINKWVDRYRPELVVCFGLNYENDFNSAFSDGIRSFNEETIDRLKVFWKFNEQGTLVAVLPFPNIPRGLLRNSSIQEIGNFLACKIKK